MYFSIFKYFSYRENRHLFNPFQVGILYFHEFTPFRIHLIIQLKV